MNEHVAINRSTDADYDVDFFAWTRAQTEALRAGRLGLVDLENIAEEIESLGSRDRRSVITSFERAVEHLVKLRHSPSRDPRYGWRNSVDRARRKIELIFEVSPSLRSRREELFEKAWKHGVKRAARGLVEDGINESVIMLAESTPTLTVEQVLDPDFFPGD